METQGDAESPQSLDVLRVVACGEVDYLPLLRAAIDGEDDCTECLPGKFPYRLVYSALAYIAKSPLFLGAEMTASEDSGRPGPHPLENTVGPSRASGAEKTPPLPPSRPSRQHKKRARERNEDIVSQGYRPSAKNARKYLNMAEVVGTDLDTAKLPVANGAHTALNRPVPANASEIPDLEKLAQHDGFQYIACGKDRYLSKRPVFRENRPAYPHRRVTYEAPRPIVDRNELIIGLIGGGPLGDPTYYEHASDLFKIIAEESNSDTFTADELRHKRGGFPAVNFGFTLPHGFQRPINLDRRRHEEKVSRITASPGFKRISAFQNGMPSYGLSSTPFD